MRNRGLPIRRQLLTVAVLLCLAMLSVTVAGLVAVNAEEGKVVELAEVTGPAISLNSAVLQTMTSAESGLRGYLASGDPALLALYNEQQALAEQDRLGTLLASRQFGAADQDTYQRQQAARPRPSHAGGVRDRRHGQRDARPGGGPDHRRGHLRPDPRRERRAGQQPEREPGRPARPGRRTLTNGVAALVAATLLVMLTGLAVTAWISRTVATPLIHLRRVVQRQRQGDTDARAEEDRGPAEIRSLAIAFNETAARNAELAAEQAEAGRLQDAVVGAGQAIRYARSAREAVAITCAQVGAVLSARRVMAATRNTVSKITADAEWHAPDLDDLPDISEEMTPSLLRSADKVRNSAGPLVINDLLTGKTAQQDWALGLHRDTGATALIMVPSAWAARQSGSCA